MIKGNNALRAKAVPFFSSIIQTSGLTYGINAINFPQFVTSSSKTLAIPMTLPEKGDLVEAYLFAEMLAPSDIGLSVRVGIGSFVGTTLIPTTVYDESYIAAQHLKITGSSTPFTASANASLIIEADLSKYLLHRGDSGYSSDGFVLMLTFAALPSSDNGYLLKKFKLSCSAQLGLNT